MAKRHRKHHAPVEHSGAFPRQAGLPPVQVATGAGYTPAGRAAMAGSGWAGKPRETPKVSLPGWLLARWAELSEAHRAGAHPADDVEDCPLCAAAMKRAAREAAEADAATARFRMQEAQREAARLLYPGLYGNKRR